ncbi:hypothetical protein, partial [Martelella mangrovi]|uniref:hypothetical protein n=1 Tax=Martelella mangrovi TaxID=1397477 RepID=UPI0033989B2E
RFLSLFGKPESSPTKPLATFLFLHYKIVQITDVKIITSKHHSACQNPEVQTRQSAKLIGGSEVNIVGRESDRRPRR